MNQVCIYWYYSQQLNEVFIQRSILKRKNNSENVKIIRQRNRIRFRINYHTIVHHIYNYRYHFTLWSWVIPNCLYSISLYYNELVKPEYTQIIKNKDRSKNSWTSCLYSTKSQWVLIDIEHSVELSLILW